MDLFPHILDIDNIRLLAE
ncbi:hypothetical protein BFJ70_g17424, partial [Fusarium oxysporum]